jgi:oligopeptide transport system ATP-binding protein
MSADPLLQVTGLKVHFQLRRQGWLGGTRKTLRAVDGLDFSVAPGETFGLVGESGCGKSTTARAVLRLISATEGFIAWKGKRIDQLSERAMLPYRRQLQMIFQDPFASLNPRMTVGAIISEPMRVFGEPNREDRKLEVMHLMERVGLNPRFLNRYPHEFSGGQRQRIGIARALALSPELIFCDEPVSALDVSIQAQVINLLRKLKEELSLSYVFIAHDLSVVRHISERIGVMYLGRLVEVAPSEELYRRARHPYTRALLSAVPLSDPRAERERRRIRLEGEVPSPDRVYPGCPLADRCPRAREKCRETPPKLTGDEHSVSCFFPYE